MGRPRPTDPRRGRRLAAAALATAVSTALPGTAAAAVPHAAVPHAAVPHPAGARTPVSAHLAPRTSDPTPSPPHGTARQDAPDQLAALTGTVGTWTAVGGVVSWVSSPASGASGALAVTASSTAAPAAWSGTATGGGLATVSPGWLTTADLAAQPATGTVAVQPLVVYFGASGAQVDSVWGEVQDVTAGTWTTLDPVVAIVPPGATGAALVLAAYTSAPGQTVYLQSPSLTSLVAHPDPPVHGPLHVTGNRIVDAQGDTVVLQGVDLYGLEDSSSPPALSQTDVEQIRAWGANMVRVSLGEQLWLTSSCAYDPSYVAAVDQVVDWITQAGMVALLDLHFNQPADLGATGSCPAAGQQEMPDSGSVTFWQQVAARYASNPLVAFDLYNEPHDVSPSVWLSGGTATGTDGSYAAPGMQTLYDTVRQAGAGNLVVVTGDDWGNTPPATLLTGDDIVYSVHAYTCPDAAPPACTAADPTDPSSILDPWDALGQQVPVMVGEFGWPDPDAGDYDANVIAAARAQGWSWDAFAWDGTTGGQFGLVAQNPPDGPWEPSPSGMPVLAALNGLSP